MTTIDASPADDPARRRLAIGFLNSAHGLDHFVILIYPTVVIELSVAYGRSYADLIALSTASFIAFGFSRCRPVGSPTAGAAAT